MAELDPVDVCARIREARVSAGLTQPGLAERLVPPVHWRTVQTWELGEPVGENGSKRWTVPWQRLEQLGEVTGRTREWFLYGDDPPGVAERLDRIEEKLDRLLRIAEGR